MRDATSALLDAGREIGTGPAPGRQIVGDEGRADESVVEERSQRRVEKAWRIGHRDGFAGVRLVGPVAVRVEVLNPVESAAEAQNSGAFGVAGGDGAGEDAAGAKWDLCFVRDDVSVIVQNFGGGIDGLAESAVDVGKALQENTSGDVAALWVIGAVEKISHVAVCGMSLEGCAPKEWVVRIADGAEG